MNKKLLSVFFAVLLCVVVSVPAFADTAEDYTPHLIDNADLLTGEEESNLLAMKPTTFFFSQFAGMVP